MRPLAACTIVLVTSFGTFETAAQRLNSACPSPPIIQLPPPATNSVVLADEMDCLSQKLQRLENENYLAKVQLMKLAPRTADAAAKSKSGMFDDMSFKDWLTVLTSIVGLVIVPFTLVGIWRSRVVSQVADNWKSRQEEIGTYNDINSKYSDFLKVLLANPDVDIGEFETPRPLTTDAERYKRMTMYAILVVLMERAFLLYTAIDNFDRDLKESKRQRTWIVAALDRVEEFLFGQHPKGYETHIFATQWQGWVKYFEYYCSHEAFQEYWKSTVTTETAGIATMWQDTSFEEFVNASIAKATGSDCNNLLVSKNSLQI